MSQEIFKAVAVVGEALKALPVEGQQRVLDSVAILLGLSSPKLSSQGSDGGGARAQDVRTGHEQPTPSLPEPHGLGAKAARWLAQNKIPFERVEEVFHVAGAEVEVILAEMPGRSRREQTRNCYLMSGIRSLLASGEPTVTEAEVVLLCKKYKCYDPTNHATYRKQSTNFLAGDKDRGFVLSAPGLRVAADVIRGQSAE